MKQKQIAKLIALIWTAKNPLPVLDSVLLKDNTLTVSDLETTMIVPFKSEVKCLIPAKQFKQILVEYPFFNLEVSGQKKERKLRLRSGQNEIILPEQSEVEDFPKLPEPMFKYMGYLTHGDVQKIHEALAYVSRDELRPVMTFVQVKNRIVATDAHRLYFNPKTGKEFETEVLINKKAANVMKEIGGAWEVSISDANVKLVSEETEVIIIYRKCDGRYPNYDAVIPETHKWEIVVDAKTLAAGIKKAIPYANKITKLVEMFINGEFKLISHNADFEEEFTTVLPTLSSTGKIAIGFNGAFMLGILSKLEGPVSLKGSYPTQAITLDDRFLIMPVAIASVWAKEFMDKHNIPENRSMENPPFVSREEGAKLRSEQSPVKN